MDYPKLKNEDPTFLKKQAETMKLKSWDMKQKSPIMKINWRGLNLITIITKGSLRIWIKRKFFLFIADFLIESAPTVSSSTIKLLDPSAGALISSSTALLSSIAILITNEHILKLKIR